MNFSNALLNAMSIHYVGNRTEADDIFISKQSLSLNEELSSLLTDYFLHRFVHVYDQFKFAHATSLQYNETYNYCNNILDDATMLHPISISIAKHLHNNSSHPKIKSGELHVCHFSNCEVDGKLVDAVGIFKTENKSSFFEVNQQQQDFEITYKQGIDLSKFDKGCLVLNTNKEAGFDVLIIDNQNKGDEAIYWKDLFLGLASQENIYHQTNQFLSIAKGFVTKQLDGEFEVSKADKIDLLNRSVEYFKTHDEFDKNEFEEEVFVNKEIIKSFRSYDESYRQSHEIELEDTFEISPQAVKKQARVFKSVLKLDKNFHIYIHGNRELIEQGIEKDGRKFYKIYFNEEN
ncbi:MAG: hypothetical protein RL708_1397 [Bacteroidota bacterium]|jgi:hypothetical protein